MIPRSAGPRPCAAPCWPSSTRADRTRPIQRTGLRSWWLVKAVPAANALKQGDTIERFLPTKGFKANKPSRSREESAAKTQSPLPARSTASCNGSVWLVISSGDLVHIS